MELGNISLMGIFTLILGEERHAVVRERYTFTSLNACYDYWNKKENKVGKQRECIEPEIFAVSSVKETREDTCTRFHKCAACPF